LAINNKEQPNNELQCGVCLENIAEQGVLSGCAHSFCFICIKEWSKTSNTCPLCKGRFTHLTKLNLTTKTSKKIKIKHADQRPEVEDPEEWIEYDSEEDFDFELGDELFIDSDGEEYFVSWDMLDFIDNDYDSEEDEDFLEADDLDFSLQIPIYISVEDDIVDLTVTVDTPQPPRPPQQLPTFQRANRVARSNRGRPSRNISSSPRSQRATSTSTNSNTRSRNRSRSRTRTTTTRTRTRTLSQRRARSTRLST